MIKSINQFLQCSTAYVYFKKFMSYKYKHLKHMEYELRKNRCPIHDYYLHPNHDTAIHDFTGNSRLSNFTIHDFTENSRLL